MWNNSFWLLQSWFNLLVYTRCSRVLLSAIKVSCWWLICVWVRVEGCCPPCWLCGELSWWMRLPSGHFVCHGGDVDYWITNLGFFVFDVVLSLPVCANFGNWIEKGQTASIQENWTLIVLFKIRRGWEFTTTFDYMICWIFHDNWNASKFASMFPKLFTTLL